jgi:hypothetical protein
MSATQNHSFVGGWSSKAQSPVREMILSELGAAGVQGASNAPRRGGQILLVLAWLIGCGAGAHPLEEWRQQSPVPTGETLTALTFANGQFVAVGGRGTVLTSAQGTNWTHQDPGTSDTLRGIAYGSNQFVAVGQSFALTSTNAADWHTSFVSPTPEADALYGLHAIAYGNGIFVALAGGCFVQHCQSSIITSRDGERWSSATNIAGIDLAVDKIESLTYGNGVFLAVGVGGGNGGGRRVIWSLDGSNWTNTVDPAELSSLGNMRAVTYGGGLFVTVGDGGFIGTSADGSHWTPRTAGTSALLNGVTYAGGLFVAVGESMVTSSDGINWSDRGSIVPNRLWAVGFGDGKFLAIGEGGMILSSEDGNFWRQLSSGGVDSLRTVAVGNGNYIATGDTGALASPDGVRWMPYRTDVLGLSRVFYGNKMFVGVTGARGRGIASSDGFLWSERGSGIDWQLSDVVCASNMFVAVGSLFGTDGSVRSGVVLTSRDAESWAVREVSSRAGLRCVSYGNGMFVATESATQTLVWTSPDGIVWAPVGAIPADNILRVTYGNGLFVACGSDGGSCSGSGHGVLYWSADGAIWRSGLARDCSIGDVAFGGGLFVAVANYGGRGGQYASLLSSVDGVTWQSRLSLRQREFRAVAYGFERFVVVGDGGTVYLSGRVISDISKPRFHPEDSRREGDTVRWVIEKPSGQLQIESSDDLVTWRSFSTTVTTAANWVDIVEQGIEGPRQRFFRAKVITP